MELVDYYTDLYLKLGANRNRQTEVTVKKCADIFFCSERNAKLLIHKMENDQWICWTGGLGRGNQSKIIFLRQLTPLVTDYMALAIENGNLEKALGFIRDHKLPAELLKICYERIQKQFGYKVETGRERPLDILRIPMRRPLATLDPAFAAITSETHIARQIFDCLVNYNAETRSIVPHIAHYWENSDDRKVWTFYLRKGILFHHGKELTSEDVRYTFERIHDSAHQLPCRWTLQSLRSMDTSHPYRITVKFSDPAPLLLHFLSALSMAVLSSDIGYNANRIVGTGIFKLVKYTKEQIILERFHNYFREQALLDRVEVFFAPDLITQKRQFDVPNLPSSMNDKGRTLEENGCSYLIFNFNKSGVQHDIWFRRAMNILIDRYRMIRDLGGDRYMAANSFLPSETKCIQLVQEDEGKITTSLKKSRYHGERLKFYHFDHNNVREDAEWIRNRAAQFGISLDLVPLPLNQFYSKAIIEDADLLLAGEMIEENVELGVVQLFCNQSSLVRRFMNDTQKRRIDQLMGRFIQVENSGEWKSMFRTIEDMIRDRRLLLYLYHIRREVSFHEALTGIEMNAFGWANFSKLWIKQGF